MRGKERGSVAAGGEGCEESGREVPCNQQGKKNDRLRSRMLSRLRPELIGQGLQTAFQGYGQAWHRPSNTDGWDFLPTGVLQRRRCVGDPCVGARRRGGACGLDAGVLNARRRQSSIGDQVEERA